MNPEDIKRFETLQELFMHPGWKVLADELDVKVESIKEGLSQFGSPDSLLHYGQGRINVYRELLSWPIIINNALEEVKENEQAVAV